MKRQETKLNDKWSIQISKELKIKIKEFCKANGYSLSGYIEQAIHKAISGSVKPNE